jgi:hypothetical protein
MLQLPDNIHMLHAIGQFHVHGHKAECLYWWATNYVPGAGVIDGEIMETLWSVLNTVSMATRTASLAHWTEVLDDHMNDSNWKKMLDIGNLISCQHLPNRLMYVVSVKAIIQSCSGEYHGGLCHL